MKALKADLIVDFLDKVLKPLPSWAQSIVSTIFISVVPIFFIYSINATFTSSGQGSKDTVIKYGISFAIGGLLGDVFFHTLPHLKEGGGHGHGHGHGHDHQVHDHNTHDHHGHDHDHDSETSFVIILGIIGFFLVEKLTHQYLSHDHDHNHNHGNKIVSLMRKIVRAIKRKNPTK